MKIVILIGTKNVWISIKDG